MHLTKSEVILERQQRVRLDTVHKGEREQEKERRRCIFTELDWFADPPQIFEQPPSQYLQLSRECYYEVRKIGDPTTLVLIGGRSLEKGDLRADT